MSLERLKKWEERREKQNKSLIVQDKRRLNLSNRLTQEQTELMHKRRADSLGAEQERHNRMVGK